jgi:hypothetical protein
VFLVGWLGSVTNALGTGDELQGHRRHRDRGCLPSPAATAAPTGPPSARC